jgi:hypothetical protein
VEEIKETLLDELNAELEKAQEASDGGEGGETSEIESQIAELEKHSF